MYDKKIFFKKIEKFYYPFSLTNKIGGQLGNLPAKFCFLKCCDKFFEIAIFFVLVERPKNYALEYNMTRPLHSPWVQVFKL